MRKVLIVDTETTSIMDDFGNPLQAQAVEVGWGMYDVKLNKILACGSFFTGLSPDATTTRICDIIEEEVSFFNEAFPDLKELAKATFLQAYEDADIILAHNSPFDEKVLSLWPELQSMPKTWVNSLRFHHPKLGQRLKSLNETAASLGVTVGSAHRALGDVLVLGAILPQIPNLFDQISNQLQPLWLVTARWDKSNPYFKEIVHVIKQCGFTWNPNAKVWEGEVNGQNEEEVLSILKQKWQVLTKHKIEHPSVSLKKV
jgi:hypothetical protein